MKVLQFIASEGWGGAEKVVVELANQLAAKCELSALVLKGTVYTERFSPEVNVITTSVNGSRRNVFLLYEIAHIIRELQPDIIHTHAVKATEMIHLLGKFLPIRQVGTKHDARRAKIFNKISFVTAVSEKARQTVANHGLVRVIHNGVTPVAVKEKQLRPPFSIISVGRLDAYKGFDILIREAAKLSFDFVLQIAGEGEERQNIERLIRRFRLEDKVVLLGHREDIPELLSGSHLQIISSRLEGFSLAAIEGLFYANLLISTRVGIASEILPEDLLIDDFDIADRLEEIHHNYEVCKKKFAEIKTQQQQKFLWPEIVAQYIDIYLKAGPEN